MSGHELRDPIPEGLRGRIASLRGWDTLCLPAGQLRELVEGYDRSRAEWAAELVKNSILEAEIERLQAQLGLPG